MPAAYEELQELHPLGDPAGVPALLRDLLQERIGICLETERLDTLLDKLKDRVSATNCRSLLDYFHLLKYDRAGEVEWRRVMDAFSVLETYFWRELPQIRSLVDVVVPQWFNRTSQPLRIWSAGCATGEEPYSLAIALREGGWAQHPISIHASDASEADLNTARTAVYRERSFRALPAYLRTKYFDAPAPEGSRLRRELLLPVNFQHANIAVAEEISGLADAAVIFCRNVFIYLSPDATRRTVESFSRAMPPGGFLFIGASESLLDLTTDFEMREMGDALVYVRQERPKR